MRKFRHLLGLRALQYLKMRVARTAGVLVEQMMNFGRHHHPVMGIRWDQKRLRPGMVAVGHTDR